MAENDWKNPPPVPEPVSSPVTNPVAEAQALAPQGHTAVIQEGGKLYRQSSRHDRQCLLTIQRAVDRWGPRLAG